MSTSAPRATDASTGQQTREVREAVVVRFAGDSGDGMQLTGSQFTLETALAGLDLTTFPDYPAEIRAPVGTTFGVSAFQIHFGSIDVKTAGDEVDVLVAVADFVDPLVEIRGADDAAFERNVGDFKHPVDLARGVDLLVAVAILGGGLLPAEATDFLEAGFDVVLAGAALEIHQVVKLAVGSISFRSHECCDV